MVQQISDLHLIGDSMDAIMALIMSKLCRYPVVIALIFVFMVVGGFSAAIFFKGKPEAKVIENVAEHVIKAETGVSVDFEGIVDEVSK
jgi:hypothetical protein